MTEPLNRACRLTRQGLVEHAASDRPRGPRPVEVDSHLRDCATCARQAAMLESIPTLLAGAPLYDGALRARTLTAIATRPERRDGKLAWIVAPVGALALLLSFALPTWLLSIPLSHLLNSNVLALALALFVVHAAGAIPAGFCTVLAMRQRASGVRLEEVFHE